jgi:UDP-glucose 4-epimerase
MTMFLVTGGCGFIGSHLADALVAAGHRVRVIDNLSTGRRENLPAGTELLVGDVADPELLAQASDGIAGCFHLAAIASVQRSNEDWAATTRVNLGGTVAVMEASARTTRFPVVYASSAAVYGDCPDMPLTEAAPTRPLTAYGADKLGGECHARVAGLVHGVPTFGLRFFNVYGARQDPKSPYSGVISIFVDRARQSLPLTIHGDGGQSRDFIHVSDVVRATQAALAAATTDAPVANVCSGNGTTIAELAKMVVKSCGSASAITHSPPRLGDIRVSIGDSSRAAHLLGLEGLVPVGEGIGALVRDRIATAQPTAQPPLLGMADGGHGNS